MGISRRLIIPALCLLPGLPLSAATSGVSPAGFTITVEREVRATPAQIYMALGQVGRWWNKDHTWSGDAANLSLDLVAGGCFCERWQGNSVEHGRVIFAGTNRMVRMNAALGPLQSLPVAAVLTFELKAGNGSSTLSATYAVAGGGADLSAYAVPVEGVITEQVDRLVAHASK